MKIIVFFVLLSVSVVVWNWMTYEIDEFPSATIFEPAIPINFKPINKFTKHNLAKKWTFVGSCYDECLLISNSFNHIYSELVKNNSLIHKESNLETQFVILNPQSNKTLSSNFIILNNNLTNTISLYSKEYSHHLTNNNILLFDIFGRLRATFSPPFDLTQLVMDFHNIRDKYAEKCCKIPDKQPNRVRFNYKES
ncbi:hypothetical protein QUF50_03175 [Thiotrichales bacterium HSG1]|nr:hypothetical protein [Thiotrichales bacterium HSG1]